MRKAASSPSIANGTPASNGLDPRTNVISGCTEATLAPRLCSDPNSSLPSAPLECNATLPFQSTLAASDFAACEISESGTQNHINCARVAGNSVAALPLTCSASLCARLRDAPRPRAMIRSIEYPAARNANASAVPKLPAPTIATRGLAPMPGSIAEPASGLREPDAESRKPLYCLACRNRPAKPA